MLLLSQGNSLCFLGVLLPFKETGVCGAKCENEIKQPPLVLSRKNFPLWKIQTGFEVELMFCFHREIFLSLYSFLVVCIITSPICMQLLTLRINSQEDPTSGCLGRALETQISLVWELRDLLGGFCLLIPSAYELLVCSDFLFLSNLVLAGF